MKNHNRLFRFFILAAIISNFNIYQAFGQNKLNVLGGFGLPELLNIGLNIQNNQTQFGIRIGSFPTGPDEKVFSILGEMYYHFAGKSTLSTIRTWYVKFALNYVRDETKYVIDKYLYLNPRIGRDFNISEKIGIEIGAGLIVQLYHTHNRKKPPEFLDLDNAPSVLPSIGITLFYRIQ